MKQAILAVCCVAILISMGTIASAAPFQSESDAVPAIETNQAATVRGRVVDTEGEPIKSAYVHLLLVVYPGEKYGYHIMQLPTMFYESVLRSTRGGTMLPPPGEEAGYLAEEAGVGMGGGGSTMMLLRPGERYGYPLPGMRAMTDELGRYEIRGIPGGFSYEVWATAKGYGRYLAEEFSLKEGEVYNSRDLVLHVADMSIEGTVTDSDGAPVARANVTGNGPATGHRRAMTDNTGRFRLKNLVDEEIRILADKSGPLFEFEEAPMAPESPRSADSRGPRAGFHWYGEATASAGDKRAVIIVNKGQKLIAVELAMYHPQRHIRGEMSLTDDIWAGIDEEDKLNARKGPIEFFTLADLKVGDVTFKADQREWTWDGKAEPPRNGEITVVSCPKVVALPGKWALFADVQTEFHQYFDRRADGFFELKTLPAISGIVVGLAAEQEESGRIILRDLTIDSSTILRRRPIEGVNLNIGPPVFDEPPRTTVSLEPGRYYGMLMPTSGGENLLIRLRVDVKDPAKGEE